ncbi:hypothetical protein DFP72DRAFT_849522 [Ephemerocybe angulata]|uniref:Uncharacterized protein n=1 Tax=Ephemerocybe angulata TaxID=980116 RepID=A0A8H6HT59_9AGAR|nr:hypothetical protein DFP72DRAFT_849522 [Tulosesus angulatus]
MRKLSIVIEVCASGCRQIGRSREVGVREVCHFERIGLKCSGVRTAQCGWVGKLPGWGATLRIEGDDIAILAGCTKRTAFNVLACHREYGQTNNPFARERGRRRILNMGDITYLQSLLQADPALYLDELQEKLCEACDVEVSIATIFCTLRTCNLTQKQLAPAASVGIDRVMTGFAVDYRDGRALDVPLSSFHLSLPFDL